MILQVFALLSAFAIGLVIGMWWQAFSEKPGSAWESNYSKTRWKQ